LFLSEGAADFNDFFSATGKNYHEGTEITETIADWEGGEEEPRIGRIARIDE